MPFLLLLSALLTALTGAVVGVRPADVQIARRAHATPIQRATVVVALRSAGHAHLLGAFGIVSRFAVLHIPAILVAAPRLYLDRLRA